MCTINFQSVSKNKVYDLIRLYIKFSQRVIDCSAIDESSFIMKKGLDWLMSIEYVQWL